MASENQSEFASGLLAEQSGAPTGLHAWNGSDPAQRFSVYRNNVLVSLSAALSSAFPVCRHLVGEEFFQAMARAYLRFDPPVSPVLSEYGDGFADFIAAFAPARQLPYLPDLARLERLRIESYHAADAPTLAVEAMQALMQDPERLAALRIELHPACRMLRSRYAVFSLWVAHQHDAEADRHAALDEIDMERAEDVLLVRPVDDVGVQLLPSAGAEFLMALQSGVNLGEAAGVAAQIHGADLAGIMALLIRPGVAQSPAGV